MIGSGPFPKAAPAVFPLPGHRTMEQVMADEATLERQQKRLRDQDRRDRERRAQRAGTACPIDYGSPYAVRKSA